MTRLLIGTYNPAKLGVLRGWLKGLPVEVLGLEDLAEKPGVVAETGSSPLDNARLKARAYCEETGIATLSIDSGLYIDGLKDDGQPGVHARRLHHIRMSDDEMIAYYAGIAHAMGGRAVAQYRNGVCIAFPDGRMAEVFDDSVASKRFYLVDKPHETRVAGFPLDALSVDIESGQYYFDMQRPLSDGDEAMRDGYLRLIREGLGI